MIFLENLRIAIAALRANKMRAMLTTLGIVIGVAAVITVVSLVQGLQFMISKQLQGVGASYIMVVPDIPHGRNDLAAHQVKLTWEDSRALRDKIGGIRLITPVIFDQTHMHYRARDHQRDGILGVNQDWQEVMNFNVEHGRFLSQIDLDNRRNVAVVGKDVPDELGLGKDPIGKEIYVGKFPATVIGVMEEKGHEFGINLDDLVYIPFDSALAVFGRKAGDQVQLRLQAANTGVIDEVKDSIKRNLRQRHRILKDQPDDFQVLVQDELLATFNKIIGGITAVVGGVVSIALLVGGIGIMNIMLVSVTERTREIGVRKAVGARRRDVLLQFLIEAVTLSMVGGTLGLLIGFGLGTGIAQALPGNWPPAHVPLWAVSLSFGFSALVGIFFGIYPAGKAARLDPIDALRWE